ncbi:M56 family metallopeptidase [Micromonospora avicenniae]|uniref:M56 family metallopeptidase n=1 Tax=Micromonospora avicenniae TaxID=1198245 RepID=UPI00342E4973
MGPLLLTSIATICALKITMGVARRVWVYQTPCAAVVLWVGTIVAVPVSAGAALLMLALDPHTRATANMWSTAATAAASAAVLQVSWRVANRFVALNRAARQRRRRHEMLIDLFGVARPDLPNVDVIPDRRPFAYSVPCIVSGRIVLSQGTLDRLDQASLRAVLAHERAHLNARHHLVLQLAAAVGQTFPRSRAAVALPARVADLVEMAADCYASRRVGRRPTMTALATLADVPVPGGALAAGGHAVSLRLDHLRRQPHCCRTSRAKGVFAVAAALLVMSPAVTYLNQVIDLCQWRAM